MSFDEKEFIKRLTKTFGELDQKKINFIKKFTTEIGKMLLQEYPFLESNENIFEPLDIYSSQIYTYTQDILDKDRNYSDFKKKEDIESISHIVNSFSKRVGAEPFFLKIHKKAKQLIVEEFEEVYNLSSEGFMLLEQYTYFTNISFSSDIKYLIKQLKEHS